MPALLYWLINAGAGSGALAGWAIPTATDIAFALAVLVVISTHLPVALRTFLLTLAVVDDLLAITIIAVFYTASLKVVPLLLASIPLAVFGFLVQRRVRSWCLLLPLAVLTGVLVHESGIHATVAGVLLGFTVPVVRSEAAGGPDAGPGLAEHFEHRIRPISASAAVPVFAFFSAGPSTTDVAPRGHKGGTPALVPDSASQRFDRLVARAGLPPVCLHALRHLAASLSYRATKHLKLTSQMLGQSSATITEQVCLSCSRTSSGRPPSRPRRWFPVPTLCAPCRRLTRMCPPCAHLGLARARGYRRNWRNGRELRWGGWGSNPRPRDYESHALTG